MLSRKILNDSCSFVAHVHSHPQCELCPFRSGEQQLWSPGQAKQTDSSWGKLNIWPRAFPPPGRLMLWSIMCVCAVRIVVGFPGCKWVKWSSLCTSGRMAAWKMVNFDAPITHWLGAWPWSVTMAVARPQLQNEPRDCFAFPEWLIFQTNFRLNALHGMQL